MNQFDLAFQSSITEIRLIDARLGVLAAFINQAKQNIKENQSLDGELISSVFCFRDITRSKHSNNLFAPNDAYSLTQINLLDEVNLILSRESLFQIAQAYEITETYMYDQVSEMIRLNTNLKLPSYYKPQSNSFSDIREGLKTLKKGRKNNKHLLGILRTNSLIFSTYETQNIYDRDYKAWFEMFSEVRHSITHNRMALGKFLPIKGDCFEEYFAIKEVDGREAIFTNVYNGKEFLSNLGDYLFFIYKCVTDFTYNTNTNFSTISHVFHDPYNNTLVIP